MASAGMMTSLGVWSCRYRELRPINFGGSSTAQPSENAATSSEAGAGDEEQEERRVGKSVDQV